MGKEGKRKKTAMELLIPQTSVACKDVILLISSTSRSFFLEQPREYTIKDYHINLSETQVKFIFILLSLK